VWRGQDEGQGAKIATDPNDITVNVNDERIERDALDSLRKWGRKRSIENPNETTTVVPEGPQIMDLIKQVVTHRVSQLKKIVPEDPQSEEVQKIQAKLNREARKEEETLNVLLPFVEKGCAPSASKKLRSEVLEEEIAASWPVLMEFAKTYAAMKKELKEVKALEQQRAAEAQVAEAQRLEEELIARRKAEQERAAKELEAQKRLEEEVIARKNAVAKAAADAAEAIKRAEERMDTSRATSYVDSPDGRVLPPELEKVFRSEDTFRKNMRCSTPNLSPILPGVRRLEIPVPNVPTINEVAEPMDTNEKDKTVQSISERDSSMGKNLSQESEGTRMALDAFVLQCMNQAVETSMEKEAGPSPRPTYAAVARSPIRRAPSLPSKTLPTGPKMVTLERKNISLTVYDPVPMSSSQAPRQFLVRPVDPKNTDEKTVPDAGAQPVRETSQDLLQSQPGDPETDDRVLNADDLPLLEEPDE